ncbi:hypothetical protein [Gaoshiqia sediminis]|uniref:Uncharacterized protein n=1 Tax=Gaoshiqia sediminis TaxID=2986998 RepID=A0AA41YDT6_9BACT|nr:hypothetical protein [Gaoshiqia sediminis]MCW0484930.1 hypothetical protein [Gaoshiqia sediminis]
MKKLAVISADVIDSSKFEENAFLGTLQFLEEPSNNYLVNRGESILTSRGDSFQIMIQDVEKAFLKAIYLKSYFKKSEIVLKHQQIKRKLDLRISLAVGNAETIPDEIGKTLEEPFVLSGRALDQMKQKKQTFIITTTNAEYNKELDLSCSFLENILDGWTMAQAEVIYYLVQGFKQSEIAEKLNLTQPSVSNRIQLAHWGLIEKMDHRYKDIVSKL